MVPLLVNVLAMDQRRAAATSLVAIVPAAATGTIGYGLRGEVDVAVAAFVALGAVGGALVGTSLLRRLSLPALRWGFLALTVLVMVRMAFVVPVRGDEVGLSPLTAAGLVLLGAVMGVASGLFGIGGGVIAVPALVVLFGAGDLVAKGTSLLIMLPTALMGTWSNARNSVMDLREGALVGVAATVGSTVGTALAFVLPPRLSVLLFVVLLAFSAVQLAVRGVREDRRRRRERREGADGGTA